MSATRKSNPLYFEPNQPKDKVEMQQLWKVMDDLNSLAIDEATALQAIATIVAGSVQSVTGLDTDNIDPRNPVIQISVDGVTITGLGTPASPLAASGGGEDLDQTLTIGNDGGGQDIVNVAGLQDSSSIRSIDIENRQLVNDNGLLWTIDWNNRMTGDSSGQTSIDWENRELTDSALTPIFDWENFAFPTLAGGGTQMLTVDNTGVIGAQAIPKRSRILDSQFALSTPNDASENVVYSYEIPASTLDAGDMIEIHFYGRKTSGAGNNSVRFYLHSSSATGGNQYGITQTATTNNQTFAPRIFITGAASQVGYPATAGILWGSIGGTYGSGTLSTASSIFVVVTNQKAVGADNYEFVAVATILHKKQ